jgi:hypothetical protein
MTEPQNPYTVISAEALIDFRGVRDPQKFYDSAIKPVPCKIEFHHVVGKVAMAAKCFELQQAGLTYDVVEGRVGPLVVELTVEPQVSIKPQIGGKHGK